MIARRILYAITILVFSILLLQACKQAVDTFDPTLNGVAKPVTVETFVKPNQGWSLAIDAADNLYVSDLNEHVIRKITPTKEVTVFAGTGKTGLVDGQASKAQFLMPQGMTFDALGNLYVAQYLALRKITPMGIVSTVAGIDLNHIDFTRPDSILFVTTPSLVLDKSGNLLVADYTDNSYNNRILKITPERRVSVFLGRQFSLPKQTVQTPYVEQIRQPKGLAFDSKGNLFIIDQSFFEILKITPQGVVTKFAGIGTRGHIDGSAAVASFSELACLTIDKADNLYVGDGPYIRKITSDGLVSTIAGNGKAIASNRGELIYQDGPGDQAQFAAPQSLAFDSKGNLFVVDGTGIRRIVF